MAAFCIQASAAAQATSAGDSKPYSRTNSFAVFGEYSNDSSHILLGSTPNRKLAGIGAMYERRLLETDRVRLSYEAEFRPFIVSSDVAQTVNLIYCVYGSCYSEQGTAATVPKCVAGTTTFNDPAFGMFPAENGTVTSICGRQQTLAQGGSPAGFRINLLPRRPLQLTLSVNGGYMYSTKPIPIGTAGSFNFTFNFGGGFEYFYKAHRSVRLEYLVQHYSNHDTAADNPGVDSGYVRLAYVFGK